MLGITDPIGRAMALAAVCGSRATLGPAFLAVSQRRPGAGTWVAAALGELLADKLGVLPPRYEPALLIPRALAGAWVARETLKKDGVEDPSAVMAGAVVAAGVASIAPIVRVGLGRVLGVPDVLLGLAEDYLVLRLGAEATGLTMDELPAVAREAVEEMGEKIAPALRSIGVDYVDRS
jgi:hypothetical protein